MPKATCNAPVSNSSSCSSDTKSSSKNGLTDFMHLFTENTGINNYFLEL